MATSATPHLATPNDAQRKAAEEKTRAAEEEKREAELQALNEQLHEMTSRVRRLERTIKIFLMSDELTERQRGDLVELLAGTKGRNGDSKPIGSAAQLQLWNKFQSLSPTQRRALTLTISEFVRVGKRPKKGRA
jgi:hypothetical protein